MQRQLFTIIFFFWMILALAVSGCSFNAFKPMQDCASFDQVSNQTFAACYSSVKSLAESIDSAADSKIISPKREIILLDELDKAFEYLKIAETTWRGNIEDPTVHLELAQALLVAIQNSIEEEKANE